MGRVVRFIVRSFFTLLLIGILCAGICGATFAYYIHYIITPAVQRDVAQLAQGMGLDMNSFIYCIDPQTGEEKVYEMLKGLENRVPATSEEIPMQLKDAFVAIEDQRFYEHKGVDWKRTLGAVKTWLLGGDQYGGSTITQQLIKNATRDDDYSVKRKINEIFRALALEEELQDKQVILERYLNTIYLGYNCYGVKTAANTYFGKEVKDLTLAECAVIAGLTNNPSRYDPYNRPEQVKQRQELILDQMLKQQLITQSEHDQAVSEPLAYRPYENYMSEQNVLYTYFTDAIIEDLIEDLMTKKGYSRLIAEEIVFSGGLRIYATVDTRIQQILDEVYASDEVFPNMERDGQKPQSAMVITDKKGNIVGIAGGRGEKTQSRGFSRATDARRQPGSAIKPLASYGPAMDAGIIVPSSIVYDKALKKINGEPWPRNDGRYPSGRSMTVKSGITSSVNTIAVQVLNMLTPARSFEFLTERLGFQQGDDALVSLRTYEDGTTASDIDFAPLGLGGLTNGVTVREMAGGFSAFINDGVFAGTRTYTKVLDSTGNVLLENTPREDLGFRNVRTAYYMLDCLQNVTRAGTATNARINGVETAGKTGTTTSNNDIWFCGVTPKYSAAVWVGYDSKYKLNGLYGRNAAAIWTHVLTRVHEGDTGLVFDSHPQDFETISYCIDTGLLPSGACRSAGRVASGRFWRDQVPTELCSHQGIEKYDLGKGSNLYQNSYNNNDNEATTQTPAQTPEEQPPAEQTPTVTVDPETGQAGTTQPTAPTPEPPATSEPVPVTPAPEPTVPAPEPTVPPPEPTTPTVPNEGTIDPEA